MQLVKKSLPALLKEYHFWSSGTTRYILLSLLIAFSLFFGVELCLNFFLRFIFHGLTFLLFPFLLSIGIHKVTIHDVHSSSHTLNRYYAMWNKPRPESSIIVCPSLKLTFLSIGYVLCINCGEDDR
jgi:hypothetical protein